jgi:hypothetical protein
VSAATVSSVINVATETGQQPTTIEVLQLLAFF